MAKPGQTRAEIQAEAKAGGFEFYYTGAPCRKGHVCERYIGGYCRLCTAEKAKISNQKNGPRYRAENQDKIAEYNKVYYHRDRENQIARVKKYQKDNEGMVKAKAKVWREKARPARLAAMKEWCEKFPEKRRANEHKRRAREANGPGFTGDDVTKLFEAQKGKCVDCLKSIADKFHIDHIYPLSRGGLNSKENIQLLCPKCNNSKYNKLPHEWARMNGRLI